MELVKKKHNLTAKQLAFCEAYVRLGNKTAAYKVAYNTNSMAYDTIKNEAYVLTKNPDIAMTIAQLVETQVDAENLTDEWIIERLMQEATTAPTDGARAACLKTLAQVKAMLIQVHRDEQDNKTDEQSALEIAGINYMPPPASPDDLKAEDRQGYDWLLGRLGV